MFLRDFVTCFLFRPSKVDSPGCEFRGYTIGCNFGFEVRENCRDG